MSTVQSQNVPVFVFWFSEFELEFESWILWRLRVLLAFGMSNTISTSATIRLWRPDGEATSKSTSKYLARPNTLSTEDGDTTSQDKQASKWLWRLWRESQRGRLTVPRCLPFFLLFFFDSFVQRFSSDLVVELVSWETFLNVITRTQFTW